MKLIDANILIYAIDAHAEHHDRASAFLEGALNSDEVIALPWTVLTAVLRVLTHAKRPMPIPVPAVLSTLDGWLLRPNVVTVEPGREHWRILRELVETVPATGNLVPDAHLAALAIENGAELCSADTDFSRFPRLKWTDPTRAS